jgi:hypothetical protein
LEIRNTFRFPDITNWWHEQENTDSKYTNLSNVACDMFSIIPPGVEVEASIFLWWDLIGSIWTKTTVETLREEVIARQFDQANSSIKAG